MLTCYLRSISQRVVWVAGPVSTNFRDGRKVPCVSRFLFVYVGLFVGPVTQRWQSAVPAPPETAGLVAS